MYLLKKLQLYEADKESLYNGKCLTDNIIDAAQVLLRKAYHHIGGLEPVCLGQTLQFTVQRGEFVQILNVSKSHWITVSNIGCKPGTVNIINGIPNNPISSHTKNSQPPSLHHHTGKKWPLWLTTWYKYNYKRKMRDIGREI